MSRRLVATLSKAWRGVVWYMREISGEARYDLTIFVNHDNRE